MAVFTQTLPDFNLTSTWKVTSLTGTPYYYSYSTPTTAKADKYFDISSIPSDAIIQAATLEAEFGSPYTGAKVRTVDGTTFHSPP